MTKRSGKSCIVVMRYAAQVRLRNAVFHWARVAVLNDPKCRSRYAALRARGHSYGRALRGVGDRLLGVACVLLQRGMLFDPDHGVADSIGQGHPSVPACPSRAPRASVVQEAASGPGAKRRRAASWTTRARRYARCIGMRATQKAAGREVGSPIWAPRHGGVRTSKRRVLRLMREHGLLAPSRVGAPRGPRNHDGTIIPDTVDAMWGTDLTTTITGEGQAAVFVAVDHCSAECVGIHAAAAGDPLRGAGADPPGRAAHFGGFAEDIARGLAVRHDHGSQYMADDFQQELRFLGIESSPAFVRAPEGNGCAERFIRTLKENLLWVRTFDTVEELRQALLEFRDTYNATWLIERHGFRPPNAVRQDQLSTAALAA